MRIYNDDVIHDSIKLERAKTPEELGLSSEAIKALLNKLDTAGTLYHSAMIIRGGIVAAERHRFPFAPGIPHIMYSISKNITGIAVGFAVNEGYVTLDDRLIDIFPEYAPSQKKPDEKLEKLTLRHLLTMTSGKMPSYMLNKTKGDWARHLLDAKWVAEPGTKFDYVNENTYMLCAVLQKVTGMSVTDFLTPRLWEPLGIHPPFWETDKNDIESGGWGIYLTPESFAKVFFCVSQKGVWGGKQVIPADFIEQALLNQFDKNNPSKEPGYGYSFWRRENGRIGGEGMFGQLAFFYEGHEDLLFVFTCGETDAGIIYDAADEFIQNGGLVKRDPEAKPDNGFLEYLNSNPFDVIPSVKFRSPMESTISGKNIRFDKERLLNVMGYPLSILPLPAVYMTKNRAGNIDNVKFRFGNDTCTFQWTEGDESNIVECGMDGEYRYSKIRLAEISFTVAGAAFWRDNYTLEVWLRPLETICRRNIVFEFKNGSVGMKPSSTPPMGIMLDSVAWAIKDASPELLKQKVDAVMEKLKDIAEPIHTGKY